MLIFSYTALTARNRGLKSFIDNGTRAFCVSTTSKSPDPPQPVKTRTLRTKKKLSELPTTYILPDGKESKPLPPWNASNVSNDAVIRTPRRRAKAKNTELKVEIDINEAALPEKKVRKRRVKVETLEAVPSNKKRPLKREDVFEVGQPRNDLAQEILGNLARFPDCLLLTRVGHFYESYFDQAAEIAQLLNIKLTSRKWDGQAIAMCGFPIMHLDKYLKVLVQQNKRFVALCEEFPIAKYSDINLRQFERRVSRVVTPGTLIDESFLNQYENNFLLSVSVLESTQIPTADTSTGLAWIDVSTGEFFSKVTDMKALRDDIARIGPREVILPRAMQHEIEHPIFDVLKEDEVVISFASESQPFGMQATPSEAPTISDEIVSTISPPSAYSLEESKAITLLTAYMRSTLLEHMPALLLPNKEIIDRRMQIDSHTIKALEIRENIREGGSKGSLLSVVKRTVTTSGTRLLSRWLCAPSTSLSEINARQSLVALLLTRTHFRADLSALLKRADDASRIVQRFLMGKGESIDFSSLNTTMGIFHEVQRRINEEKSLELIERGSISEADWQSLDSLCSRFADLSTLSERINMAVSGLVYADSEEIPPGEDTPNGLGTSVASQYFDFSRHRKTRYAINPEFSPELKKLHGELRDLLKKKDALESKFQSQYDAPSLTLRTSPSAGMHVHLGRSKRDQASLNKESSFIPISESASTKSYFNQKWSALGSSIFQKATDLQAAERNAFENLRHEVTSHSHLLRRNARILDELDITLAFATLAEEMRLVKPVMTEDFSYVVNRGRHPTVELGLLNAGRMFTPNSISIDENSRVQVITGPNMAGKSTLLRQTALIAILAQTGSFVPADSATLGLVDRVFSRVGARDDLFHNRSTFMVEMLETAEILSRATPRSLVIMDEVGRGTTVKDGLAIAFATINHLVSTNRCRALFATHYHELADMLGLSGTKGSGIFSDVSFFCTDVGETTEHFAYSYRLRPGVNHSSHGLKVAQLAGLPRSALDVASKTMAILEARKVDTFTEEELKQLGNALALS